MSIGGIKRCHSKTTILGKIICAIRDNTDAATRAIVPAAAKRQRQATEPENQAAMLPRRLNKEKILLLTLETQAFGLTSPHASVTIGPSK
jgi:hypothetical protein